jgi:fatty acid desaturase
MLRFKKDRRTLAFVGAYYALIALGFSVHLTAWGTALLSVTLCFVSFFCAVITHNTVHSPIFHSRVMNRFFQIVLTPSYGHPVNMFVPGHNLSHHKYLQEPKDRMRTDKMRFRWNLLNQIFFAWVVGGPITRDNFEYAAIMRTRKPAWFRQLLLELGAWILFLAITFAIDWKRFIFFVLIPHQYAAWGIMGVNFIQHEGCDGDHPYNHSRNFVGGLTNWFTFNNGYHGIHHMHPALHWSQVPEVHARELHGKVDPRLEQPSMLAYCFRAYIWPGKRMRYDGTPVVLGPLLPDEPWVPDAIGARAERLALVEDLGAAA